MCEQLINPTNQNVAFCEQISGMDRFKIYIFDTNNKFDNFFLSDGYPIFFFKSKIISYSPKNNIIYVFVEGLNKETQIKTFFLSTKFYFTKIKFVKKFRHEITSFKSCLKKIFILKNNNELHKKSMEPDSSKFFGL